MPRWIRFKLCIGLPLYKNLNRSLTSSKAHRLAKGLRTGSVWINCYQAIDPALPFSGYKISGYGGESGIQQTEVYLNEKAVWITTA